MKLNILSITVAPVLIANVPSNTQGSPFEMSNECEYTLVQLF